MSSTVDYGMSDPLLDARLTGAGVFTATANSTTTFTYTVPFDCKMNGIQLYAKDSNLGDYIDMESQYNAGAYGWKRYKKFGKHWYISPNTQDRIILFPTEPKSGVRFQIKYTNTGNADVTFILNLFMFVNQVNINPSILQEGEDW